MSILELSKNKFLDPRYRFVFKNKVAPLNSCKAIIEYDNFQKEKVVLRIHGEDMLPDIKKKVNSFSDISESADNSDIATCLFKIIFKNTQADILVDFDFKEIVIVADSTALIDEIKIILEEKLNGII